MYFINSFLVNFALLLFHMKKLITLCCLTLSVVSGSAQTAPDSSQTLVHSKLKDNRINVSVQTGAAVGFAGKSAVSSGIYLAPVIGYRVTSRFKFNMGLMHYNINSNSLMNGMLMNSSFRENHRPSSGNLLMLEGQYAFNTKTIVSGGVLYSTSSLIPGKSTYKGAMFGVDYKVSPQTTFSIRTTIIQGNGFHPEYAPFTNPMSPANVWSNPFYMQSGMSPFNF